MDAEREMLQKLQQQIMEDLDFGEELSDEQLKDLIGKYLSDIKTQKRSSVKRV